MPTAPKESVNKPKSTTTTTVSKPKSNVTSLRNAISSVKK